MVASLESKTIFSVRRQHLYCNDTIWNEDARGWEFIGCTNIVPINEEWIFDGYVLKSKQNESKYVFACNVIIYQDEAYYIDGVHNLVHFQPPSIASSIRKNVCRIHCDNNQLTVLFLSGKAQLFLVEFEPVVSYSDVRDCYMISCYNEEFFMVKQSALWDPQRSMTYELQEKVLFSCRINCVIFVRCMHRFYIWDLRTNEVFSLSHRYKPQDAFFSNGKHIYAGHMNATHIFH